MARTFLSATLMLAVVCMAAAPSAHAQTMDAVSPQTYEPPAHVAFVDGTAVLERDGEVDAEPRNMPLMAGDRVRTRNGRVEILFPDGATLHLDSNTLVDFQSDELIRLLEGRIRLSIPGPDRGDVFYRVDSASGWAHIRAPGEYRLTLTSDARSPEFELAVIRGQAELVTDAGQQPLRAGERAFARAGTAPSYAYVFNSASWDAFDRWSEARRSHRMTVTAHHLPSDMRRYAPAFDDHGSWRHHDTYGYVWYPRVAVDWRPYHYGRWVSMPVYGWTWVGHDPWAWPTHHYGRWGFSSGLWFWIPGRAWAPAWVAWAYAPGYVSWSPLGWNNRPLVQINIFTGRDRWHPWTVVPHRYFGVGHVHVRSVHYWNIDAGVRRSFAHRPSAPVYTGVARPRSAAPIRAAGTRTGTAVPRGSAGAAPLYTNRGADGSRITTDDGRRGDRGEGVRPGAQRSATDRGRTVEPGARAADRAIAVPRGGAPATSERGMRSQAERSAQPSDQGAPRAEPQAPATRAPQRRGAPPQSDRPSGGRAVMPRDEGSSRQQDTTAPRAVPRGVPRSDSAAPASAPSMRAPSREQRPSDARSTAPAPRAAPRGMPAGPQDRPAAAERSRPGPAPGASAPAARPSSGESRAPAARPSGGESRSSAPAARPRGGEPRSAAPAVRPSGGPSRSAAPAARPSGGEPRSSAPAARPSGGPSRSSAPAAAPSGGQPNRGAAAPGSRSRGDQPARGAATRRGGDT